MTAVSSEALELFFEEGWGARHARDPALHYQHAEQRAIRARQRAEGLRMVVGTHRVDDGRQTAEVVRVLQTRDRTG